MTHKNPEQTTWNKFQELGADMTRRTVVAAAIAACLTFTGAKGQEVFSDDRDELRRQQAEIYAEMLQAPSDADLMLRYARVSVALQDYEAAISTLERSLIFEPNEPLTHLELAVAYFRVGSYQISRYNLERAIEGGLPGELEERAGLYLAEIEERTATATISGAVTAGLIFSTNANLGPEDQLISVVGNTRAIPESFTSQSDLGAQVTASLRHRYDLGRPNNDALITDFGFYGVRFFDEDTGDVDLLSLETGPSFSLDDSAFGRKIRPFAALAHARVDNDAFYTDFGFGADYTAPIDDTLTALGELRLIRREFHNGLNEFDSVIARIDAGVAYRAAPRTQLRGAIFLDNEFTDDGDNDNTEIGLRGAASYSYSPEIEGLSTLWTLTGHARYTHRFFHDPVAVVDPDTTRDDDEFRFGLSHLFRIQDGFGVKVTVDYFNRRSDIQNFELDNLSAALSAAFEF